MFTNRKISANTVTSSGRTQCTSALALLGGLLLATPAQAQQIIETKAWSEDQRIDAALGTLQGPVLQPVLFPSSSREDKATITPLFKQQPPAAQSDFRLK